MKNILRKLPSFVLVGLVVLGIGFAPVGEREKQRLFALDLADIGIRMVEAGAIDPDKINSLYGERRGMKDHEKMMLYGSDNKNFSITLENSTMALHMLWAFGLSNKNEILEKGQMMDSRYGGADRFASTGGWNLAKGQAMDHYSMHEFIKLTDEEQKMVERMAKGIFRPCCDNSTHFPDCNHGMAMLGLLELMASQGASEKEMYKFALEANRNWFPGQYETIRAYFDSKNLDWRSADPKEILGAEYSSSSGFQNILSQVNPAPRGGGGGCGA